jgi:hypothetical protein
LREDLGYFQGVVNDYSEHRQEHLLSVNPKRHPNLGKPVFWNTVLVNVVGGAYGSFMLWEYFNENSLIFTTF